MKSPSPRASFNSSRLVHLLAGLVAEEAAGARQSFAERLGHWLNLGDAIALAGALNTATATPPAAGSRDSSAAHEAQREFVEIAEIAEFARVRAALADSIAADGVSGPEKVRLKLPVPPPGASLDSAADYLPYRRYYAAHQRDMEAGIGQLRAGVRQALARRSPALQRLAALDAVLGKALAERERDLLAGIPLLLEKRFAQLCKAHRQTLASWNSPGDSPADTAERWLRPGGWLADFRQDMRAVLLAELDVRLQPVAGLIDAFSHEVTPSQ